jgi:chondroitin-sulfate-ABC endolyase/exolyase
MKSNNTQLSRRTLLKVGGATGLGLAFVAGAGATPAAASALPTRLLHADALRAADPASLAELEARALALQPPMFLFETALPPQLTAEDGSTVAISDEQAIIGAHSLKWDFAGGSAVRFTAPLDSPDTRGAGSATALLGSESTFGYWVHSAMARDEVLRFEFGRDGGTDAWFEMHLGFNGWRTAWIRLATDLSGTPRRDMNTVRLIAPPSAGTLFIDQLVLNTRMRSDHPSRDRQVPFVNPEGDTAPNGHWLALLHYQEEFDAQPIAPSTSAEHLADVAAVTAAYHDRYLASGVTVTDDLVATLTQQLNELGVPERGTSGPATPIFTFQQAIFPPAIAAELVAFANATTLRAVTDQMQKVARAYDRADAARKPALAELYLRSVEHIRAVGWAAGSCQGTIHHVGYQIRGYYDSVYLMQDVLREASLFEAVRDDIDWFSGMGRMLERPIRLGGIMDIFNCNVRGLVAAALLRDTPQLQASHLAVVRDYLNLALKPSPGLDGGVKTDGSGFHHGGFYPAYSSDGYSGLAPMIAILSGSSFRISGEALGLLKKSVLLMRTYANKVQWALPVCNRHPLGTDALKVPIFQWLAQAGTPDSSAPLDPEIGAAFLRLLPQKPNSAQRAVAKRLEAAGISAEASPTGNWTMNYGALNVHRRDDWSVVVRGHNRYLWATEIYVSDNIYGRYSTYGQIQVQGRGDPVNNLDSGFSQEGWDWCRFPGTTAKRLPIDEMYTDLGSGIESLAATDSRFGGACSIDGTNGMFAMELHENPAYDASHRARKSVFLFDDRVIAVGSAIENRDTIHETATTLFQSHLAAASDPTYLNSTNPQTVSPFSLAPDRKSNQAQWLIDAQGNGYYLPRKQRLGLERGTQHSKDQSSGAPTSGDFATAWLSHGTRPNRESYEYAILVNRTPRQMMDFVSAMEDVATAPYRVLEASADVHVVFDRASGITAYAVFEPRKKLKHGPLVSADTPSLIMTRSDAASLTLSVADPDLRLYEGIDEAQYDSNGNYVGNLAPNSRPWATNPSASHQLTLTVDGRWRLQDAREGVQLRISKNETTVAITTVDGVPVQLLLVQA